MSALVLHAPRPRLGAHSGCMLEWEDTSDMFEITNVAQQLAASEVVIKPKEMHLAFNWGPLRSRKYSRFRRLRLPMSAGKPSSAASRSNTMTSIISMTMTLSSDVSVLITHPIRRESTYIVWGAVMAVESPTANVSPRKVIVKIAVDEEGGDDLREDARLHENLAGRGLALGYYGIFTDSIGSTALVIDDFNGELEDGDSEFETPTP